jgi:lincosamide nucleotidyltransferase
MAFRHTAGAAPALDRRIGRLREAARTEPRLDGALRTDRGPLGAADAYSDTDAYPYIQDTHAQDVDAPAFPLRPAPLRLASATMSCTASAPVVTDGPMRGEFPPQAAGHGQQDLPALVRERYTVATAAARHEDVRSAARWSREPVAEATAR